MTDTTKYSQAQCLLDSPLGDDVTTLEKLFWRRKGKSQGEEQRARQKLGQNTAKRVESDLLSHQRCLRWACGE